MTKTVNLGVLLVVLAGCTTTREAPPALEPVQAITEQDSDSEISFFRWGEQDSFPDTDSLLAYREWGCALDEAQRVEQLRERRQGTDPVSVTAALMLASCAPDKNPGLLVESLEAARNLEGTSTSFGRLVNLLEDQAHSYRVVEQRLQQKQVRLQELVKGIREIEDQMRLGENGEDRE